MIRALSIFLFRVALVLFVPGTAAAQAKAPVVAVAADKETRSDDETADSPRASMRTFLELAEQHRFAEAAVYLDLPNGNEKRGAELAARLHAVLAQRLLVVPEQLSPLAQGRPTDGLPAGTEELGKVTDGKGHPVSIRLVRHESKAPDDEPRWVFSQSTVAHIDPLYGALGDRWVRERFPPVLLENGPLGLHYWQWLAVPVLGLVSLLIGRLFAFVTARLAARFLEGRPWRDRIVTGLRQPATLGWALGVFAVLMPYLALALRSEDLALRVLRALGYLAFFWALLRTVAVIGDEIAAGRFGQTHPNARSISAVGVRLGKVIVAAVALTVALSELGFPVASVIAGLGIGGVALALAAQKTVENLFGSVSILVDRPFRVGDLVRVDAIEGRVETIGLRSTRIRTADRSLVIFPNGKLADMRIESLEAREWIRFTTKLQLSRLAKPDQLRGVVATLRDRLEAHPKVRKEDLSVRLSAIGEASFDIEVAALVDTTESAEFASIREELLHHCVQVVETVGAALAIPTRQLLAPATPEAAPPPVNPPRP